MCTTALLWGMAKAIDKTDFSENILRLDLISSISSYSAKTYPKLKKGTFPNKITISQNINPLKIYEKSQRRVGKRQARPCFFLPPPNCLKVAVRGPRALYERSDYAPLSH